MEWFALLLARALVLAVMIIYGGALCAHTYVVLMKHYF